MVCAQSKGDLNRLLPSLGKRGNRSVLLGYVDAAIGSQVKRGGGQSTIQNSYKECLGHEILERWLDKNVTITTSLPENICAS